MNARDLAERYAPAIYALLLLGLFGFVQPWIAAPTGALTLNAYDLAEWASLVPAQRATSPPLLAPLLLRLQLVILSVILAASVTGRWRKLAAVLAIAVLTAAQLPPFEFVHDLNNLNYRQQFFLAGVSLIAGFALLPLELPRVSRFVSMVLAVAGLATAMLGLSQSAALYDKFQLDPSPAAGAWIMGLSYIGMIVLNLRIVTRARISAT